MSRQFNGATVISSRKCGQENKQTETETLHFQKWDQVTFDCFCTEHRDKNWMMVHIPWLFHIYELDRSCMYWGSKTQ